MAIRRQDSTRSALESVGLLAERCDAAAAEPAGVLAAIRTTAEDTFGGHAVALRLMTSTRELVPPAAASDGAMPDPRPVSLDDWPPVAQAVDRGEPLLAPDPPSAFRLRAPIAVPLGQAPPVGVLVVEPASWPDETEAKNLLHVFGAVGGLAFARALEQERVIRLSDLRSQFIARAAHELRAPFAILHGTITTLNDQDDLPPEHEESLHEVLFQQTQRTTRLIDQVLDLSGLDASAVPIERERFRVRERLEDVVAPVAADRPDDVRLELPAHLVVDADPTAVERIVANLVTNALRHGRPPVTIEARQHDRHFQLSVEDRGAGVERSFVPHLFDRFSRSDAATPTEGSGLGLAIARSYAHAHGGELVYTRAEPQGARFELVLPHASSNADPPASGSHEPTAAERSASSTSSA